MFNLENAIQSWKQSLKKSLAFEEGQIKEMETHLRDEIDALTATGIPEEEAFNRTAEKFGPVEEIGDEVYKTKTTKKDATPPWKQKSWGLIILPRFFVVAIRKFRRNPAFSIINVLGLSVALSVCLLVISFANNQARYDSFHKNADNIYRITTTLATSGGTASEIYASSTYHLGPILKNNLPEIREITRLQPVSESVLIENSRFSLEGLMVDPTFFELFDFNLISGNRDNLLTLPNSIVLTKETAERFFGNSNPVGRDLIMQGGRQYQVTGVLDRQNERSHLEFEALIPIPTLMSISEIQDWENPTWYTYLLLDNQTNPRLFESKISPLIQSFNPTETRSGYEISLQPLTGINLGPLLAREVGRITPVEFVYFLFALAFVIILAAGINYVNLTVARSLQRVGEIGMRKIIGANRIQLVGQFLSESIVIAFISLGIGFFIFWGWLLPYWNSMRLATADFGQIFFSFSSDTELLLIFTGFTLLVGLCAGFYPALKLSSISPMLALKKGWTKGGFSGWSPTKSLVVFQIALSVILVVSTIFLYRQSNLLLNADYGFQHSNMINVELGDVSYETFKHELSSQSGVAGTSAVSKLPGVHFPDRVWVKTNQQTDSIYAAVYSVDENMIDNLGIDLLAGRSFSLDHTTDSGGGVIINELATQRFGFDSPREALGTYIELGSSDDELQIVGIVDNFQYDFLWKTNSPLILWNNPMDLKIANIRFSSSINDKALEELTGIWQNIESVAPFEYQYYSQQIENVYADFMELADVISFLAIIAILIACMGLLAMTHYDTQKRKKEIGVRKVLGASVKDLVLLLSSDFSKMMGMALLLAIPAAIYLNKLWLQIFANRIDLTVKVIGMGALAVTILALLSVGWQTTSAALENPINNLRSE